MTEKIEDELLELEEVEALESTSSTGISRITVELKETITDVDPVWSKVRSRLDDVVPELPATATKPEYRDSTVSASALIVGLVWDLDTSPNYAILRRLAEGLSDRVRAIPGTDKVEDFGEPDEEIRVEISSVDLARLGLTTRDLAGQIQASDAKVSSGQLRSPDAEFLFEVDSELDSLARVRQIPIQLGSEGQTTTLGDIATVEKGATDPPSDVALVNGRPAIAISATVESDYRVDSWAKDARKVIEAFRGELSDGLSLQVILDQSQYVQQRLDGVIGNLILGSSLVIGVSLFILGWKSALIVGSALPLATLMVFGWMKVLGIPLHQMSVTGIIIALGLLIDNAIVVVDEMQVSLQEGYKPLNAVSKTVKHLLVPLLASTLTTVLAFMPIAFSPGPTGEFIGTIGLTVILALLSSLFLSLTVIVALVGRVHYWQIAWMRWQWLRSGFSHPRLTAAYRRTLQLLFRRPWLGVGLALILPIFGFSQFATLEQQFFPPTNRDQFQIEVEFPSQTALSQTRSQVLKARDLIRQHPEVSEVHWFLGKSAPAFFYNVIPTRENAPEYAQAIVQLHSADRLRETLQSLQTELDAAFPAAQVLVKQLEQGPPFDAPIELRLYGSEIHRLRTLGDELRGYLSQLPAVTHTRADLSETLPKLALSVDEVQARRAGLDNSAIALQLDAALEGAIGGSILEDTEDIPIRVRVPDATRGSLSGVASLDLVSPHNGATIPLDTLAEVNLVPNLASISHRDGERVNTVSAFLKAGELPDTVLKAFEDNLQASGWELPTGYRMEYGGEADARGSAVGNLLSTVGVLGILMSATLVLSFNSFGLAAVIGSVAIAAMGLAFFALWLFDSLFGFTAILGTLGLVGLAINDSIVVLAALRENPQAREGNWKATQEVVLKATRHVIATTLTTIMGFVPLMLDKTGFWPPLAIAIAGGLGGATLLALYYVPSVHLLLHRRQQKQSPQVWIADNEPLGESIGVDA